MSIILQNSHLVRIRSLEPICQPLRKCVSFHCGQSQGACPFVALGSAPPPPSPVSFQSLDPRKRGVESLSSCTAERRKPSGQKTKTPLHWWTQRTVRWSLSYLRNATSRGLCEVTSSHGHFQQFTTVSGSSASVASMMVKRLLCGLTNQNSNCICKPEIHELIT